MWEMWLSSGTKGTVYCPASVCLISASVSLYLWKSSVWMIPTAVSWRIHSPTGLNISTSLKSVWHVQVCLFCSISLPDKYHKCLYTNNVFALSIAELRQHEFVILLITSVFLLIAFMVVVVPKVCRRLKCNRGKEKGKYYLQLLKLISLCKNMLKCAIDLF